MMGFDHQNNGWRSPKLESHPTGLTGKGRRGVRNRHSDMIHRHWNSSNIAATLASWPIKSGNKASRIWKMDKNGMFDLRFSQRFVTQVADRSRANQVWFRPTSSEYDLGSPPLSKPKRWIHQTTDFHGCLLGDNRKGSTPVDPHLSIFPHLLRSKWLISGHQGCLHGWLQPSRDQSYKVGPPQL